MLKHVPSNDDRRTSALKLIKTHTPDAPPSVIAIIDKLPYDIDELLDTFNKETAYTLLMEDYQNKHVDAKNLAKEKARKYMSDFLNAFIKAVDRDEYERSHLKLFKLNLTNPSSAIARTDKVVDDWVSNIDRGIQAMAELGLPLVERPAEADVLDACKKFHEALAALLKAKEDVQDSRKPLKITREKVNAFLNDISLEIAHLYRKYTSAEQRDKLRLWGVEYSFDSAGDEAAAKDAFPPTGDNIPIDMGDVNPEVDDGDVTDDDIGIDEEGVN